MVSRVSFLTLVVGFCAVTVWSVPAFAQSYNPRLDSDGATASTSAAEPVRAAAYLPPRSREADRRVVVVQRGEAQTARQTAEGPHPQPQRTAASTGGQALSGDPASVSNPRRVIATRPQPQAEQPQRPQSAAERASDMAQPVEQASTPVDSSEAPATMREADEAADEPEEVYAAGIFLNEQDLGPDVEQRFAPEAQEVDDRPVQRDSADSRRSDNPVTAAQYLPESAQSSQQASGGYRQLYDSHPQQQVYYSPSNSSGYTSQQRTTVHHHHHYYYHHHHYRPRPVYIHRTYYCPPPRRVIYRHRPVFHRHHFHRPHRKYYHRSTSVGVRYRGDRWRVGVRVRF